MSINPLLEQTETNSFGETYFTAVNRGDFDIIDSKSFYKQYFKINKPNTCFCIIGTDSGLFLSYILSLDIAPKCEFIFVELDSVLQELNFTIPNNYKNKITVCSLNELNEVFRSKVLYFSSKSMYIFLSVGAKSELFHEYNSFNKDVLSLYESIHNQFVTSQNSIFPKNALLNTADNNFNISILKNIFLNKSAVIVGAAPSLKSKLPWLKKHQDNIIIFCVSRVYHILKENGITPHIIVSVDPHLESLYNCKEMLKEPSDIPFLVSRYCLPQLVSQWNGPIFYYDNKYAWNFESETGFLGSTVSSNAINHALNMGCTQLILIGVDLCFAKDGAMHIDKNSINLVAYAWIKNNAGELAETDINFREEVESIAQIAKANLACQFINTSITAAFIDGVAYQELDSIEYIKTPDIKLRLNEKFNLLTSDSLLENLISSKKELTKFLQTSDSIKRDIEKSLKVKDTNLLQAISILSKQYEYLRHKSNTYKLVMSYDSISFTTILTMETSSDKERFDQLKQFLDFYLNTLKTIDSDVLTGLNIINSRLEEHKSNPNISLILEQWRLNNQVGRINILDTTNLDAAKLIPESERVKLKQEFHDLLNSNLKKNKVNTLDLVKIKQKLKFLEKEKQKDSIPPIIDLLENSKVNQDFINYAKALFEILNEKYDIALSFLLEIQNPEEDEFSLISKAAINLGNIELALFAMQQIVHLNNSYLPLYASLLNISGDHVAAINSYLDYLEIQKEDVLVWLQLAEILVSIEKYDDAKVVYLNILEIDSHNIVAKTKLEHLNIGVTNEH